MGFGGISPLSLLLILGIVILLFGTKKLRSMGGDLGSAIKNFKQSMQEGEQSANTDSDKTIDHEENISQETTTEKDKHSS